VAHFRGTVQGNQGEASRLGSKRSGLRATVNAWERITTRRARIVSGFMSPEAPTARARVYRWRISSTVMYRRKSHDRYNKRRTQALQRWAP